MSSFYPPSLRLFNFQQFHCHCRDSWNGLNCLLFCRIRTKSGKKVQKIPFHFKCWYGRQAHPWHIKTIIHSESLDQVSWLPNNKYGSDSIIINIIRSERDGVTCNTCNCSTRGLVTFVTGCDAWHVTCHKPDWSLGQGLSQFCAKIHYFYHFGSKAIYLLPWFQNGNWIRLKRLSIWDRTFNTIKLIKAEQLNRKLNCLLEERKIKAWSPGLTWLAWCLIVPQAQYWVAINPCSAISDVLTCLGDSDWIISAVCSLRRVIFHASLGASLQIWW